MIIGNCQAQLKYIVFSMSYKWLQIVYSCSTVYKLSTAADHFYWEVACDVDST